MKSILAKTTAISLLALSSGCLLTRYSGPQLMLIPAGLPREQVVERIGKPTKSFKHEQKEIMAYEWNSAYDSKIGGMWSYVILTNGFVQNTLEQAEQQRGSLPPEVQVQLLQGMQQSNGQMHQFMNNQQSQYDKASKEDFERRETERRHQETIRALKGQQY